MNSLQSLVDRFCGKRILVVGDFMLDEYVTGKVERISPEAPVPVVEAKSFTYRAGGAANVVLNLSSLGAEPIPVGVIGNDLEGERLKNILSEKGIDVSALFTDSSRPTTKKTRILASSQQLLRVDWESRDYISEDLEKRIISVIQDFASLDGIVISDYGKGVVTKGLFGITKDLKKRIPVLLDPKEKNYGIYKNVTAMTPNMKETYLAVGINPESDEDTERAGRELIKKFNLDYAVITRSEKGLSVVGMDTVYHLPTKAKQVYDVTGAGDTVISVFTLAVSSGASLREAGEISNVAAGIVVGKLGTATVTVDELKRALEGINAL